MLYFHRPRTDTGLLDPALPGGGRGGNAQSGGGNGGGPFTRIGMLFLFPNDFPLSFKRWRLGDRSVIDAGAELEPSANKAALSGALLDAVEVIENERPESGY